LKGVQKINSSIRFANRSARFISAYAQGLDGTEAAWANKRYHSHRTLPPEMVADVKKQMREALVA
jgi:hypothetical protein